MATLSYRFELNADPSCFSSPIILRLIYWRYYLIRYTWLDRSRHGIRADSKSLRANCTCID